MDYETKTRKLKELSILIAEFDIKLKEINTCSNFGSFTIERCRKTKTYINVINSK